MNIYVELGRIAPYLNVVELTIREVAVEHDMEEMGDEREGHGEWVRAVHKECRVQGRVENVAKFKVDNVRYDVSYYSADGSFLGLDKSHFLDDDEMEPGDYIPIDMCLDMPEDVHRCVFNARAKKAGWLGRLL